MADNTTPSPDAPPPRLLSVLIPAYNEESQISTTVEALTRRLEAESLEYEILVVDDASTDRTASVLMDLELRLPRLRYVTNTGRLHGYGHAVRRGLEDFRGDAVVVTMADGSDSPDDLVAYYRKIQDGYDCAFGSRFGSGAEVAGYPPIKRVLNRMGNGLIAFLLGSRYTDYTNGFKCFRRHVIADMQPLVSGQFNLTIEMSLKAVLGGASFSVVPNNWVERSGGVSKFRVFDVTWLYLITIVYCLIHAKLKRTGVVRPGAAPALAE